jgi:hypothetical protein
MSLCLYVCSTYRSCNAVINCNNFSNSYILCNCNNDLANGNTVSGVFILTLNAMWLCLPCNEHNHALHTMPLAITLLLHMLYNAL